MRAARLFTLASILLAGLLSPAMAADEPGRSRLVKILVGRNESIRMRALAPLHDDVAAKIESLDELIFALQSHVDQPKRKLGIAPSTAELIDLIASVARPEAEQALIAMLDCEQVEIAMICADALGRYQCFDTIDALKMQVKRPEWKTKYGFRFNLVRALVQMDHPDAYEFLGYVKKTIDGQLLHELNKQFAEVTLDNFRGDTARYEAWKAGNRRQSMFKQASFSESADRMRLQRQQYYGIDIDAKRIMFIIDHSGSMKKPTYRGTRLTQAKQELVQAITMLPSDHEFAIVFYEANVREWRDQLVPATEKNKEEAIKFVSRLQYGTSTNTHGALRRSLDFDDELETVFLLTDGRPTSGTVIARPAIINDIVHRNRLRHLTINTIGIAVDSDTEYFLQTLAKRCGGEYRRP